MTRVSPVPRPSPPLARQLAGHLRAHREPLVQRWLDRIAARTSIPPERLFPSDQLLDHVPLLVDGIAAYVEAPESESDVAVAEKARELGQMRHAQGFDAHQILKEYALLGGILCSELMRMVEELVPQPAAIDVAICWTRLFEALERVRLATTSHFLQLASTQVNEREARLRRFNRTVSHELKNHVSAIGGAAAMLEELWVDASERDRFIQMVRENATALERVLANLAEVSQLDGDSRRQRNVLLSHAAFEVARQLRAAAAARGVEIRRPAELPAVEVNGSAVELCLGNFVHNAIKYCDPAKEERWVAIEAELVPPGGSNGDAEAGGKLVVRVRDNGRGVAPEDRESLFQPYHRGHQEGNVEGTGLGLSIVRETVRLLGGDAWAEFPEVGTVFCFSLPSRRGADSAAAGVDRSSDRTAERTGIVNGN